MVEEVQVYEIHFSIDRESLSEVQRAFWLSMTIKRTRLDQYIPLLEYAGIGNDDLGWSYQGVEYGVLFVRSTPLNDALLHAVAELHPSTAASHLRKAGEKERWQNIIF